MQLLQQGISTGCASTAMEKRMPVTGQQWELEFLSLLSMLLITAAVVIIRLSSGKHCAVFNLQATETSFKRSILA